MPSPAGFIVRKYSLNTIFIALFASQERQNLRSFNKKNTQRHIGSMGDLRGG